MSKASALGAGRFGSSTAAPVSARRQAIGAATGVPTEGVAPPTVLPVDRISLNPDNPRSVLGDLADLAGSLVEHGQKQAITVMNRDAYVKANPAREKELDPNTTHVVIDGSSRLAAAREAGLSEVKVWVDDDQGADSEAILESALVANIHRQDLAELDEARALQRLLVIHGSQTALAHRLHKSQGWVSQRLALLNLTPELKEKIGQEPITMLRAVGNKPHEEQAGALETLKEKAAEKERAKKQAAAAAKDERPREDPSYYGVIEPGGSAAPKTSTTDRDQQPDQDAEQAATTEPLRAAAPTSDPRTEESSGVPEPRNATATEATSRQLTQGPQLPYDDPSFISMHLNRKMEPGHFTAAARQMATGTWDKAGTEAGLAVLSSMLDSAAERCPDEVRPLLEKYLVESEH